MKTAQIFALTAGTVMLLWLVNFSLQACPTGRDENEDSKRLSYYLLDTDFLEQCARKHQQAIAHSPIIAPEIRFAVLHLASGGQK